MDPDDWLREGVWDSSGEFTLDAGRAWQKLSAHLLPVPEFWVLKLVQAAVAWEAEKIGIHQRRQETEVRFRPPPDVCAEQLRRAYLDTRPAHNAGLDHLKRGLWTAGFGEGNDFCLRLPGRSGVLWGSGELDLQQGSGSQELVLTVTRVKGGPIESVLRERAYTCPIPLRWNGDRLDGLQFEPDPSRHAYQLLLVEGSKLALSRRTYSGDVPSGSICHCLTPEPKPARADAACLVSLVRGSGEGGRESLFCWVRDGVVVATQTLNVGLWDCCCRVYASAHDVALDLSGFQLAQPVNAEIQRICRSFSAGLRTVRIDLKEFYSAERRRRRWMGAALAGVGTLFSLVAPMGLLASMGFLGAGVALARGEDVRPWEASLQGHLEGLLLNWGRLVRE
jgi:hypothetical protein